MSNITQDFEAQQANLVKRIEAGREKSGNILDTIQNDGDLLNDFVMDLGRHSPISFTSNGSVKLNIDNGEHHEYTLHPHAIVQAGDKLGINSTFIKDLAYSSQDWKKELIATNLNTFVQNTERNRALVRTVGTEVRAVLSDAYKRIDSQLIYRTFIEQTNVLGMQIIDAHYDGLTGWLESVYPTAFTVDTPRNGRMIFGFGARMKTSDFGTAANEFSKFAFQIVCYNGMQSQSIIRQVHTGARLPDDIKFAEDTMLMDSQAASLKMRDAVKQIMSPRVIEADIEKIKEASSIVIDVDGKLKELSRSNKLGKGEIETLKKVITNNRPEDGVQGENTLLKLSQAIGRVGVIGKDEVRKRELDELAYSLINKN